MGQESQTCMIPVYSITAVLEIVVRHQAFSDQNWYLSEHVPVWSDIMSYHNVLTIGKNLPDNHT